MSTLTELLPAVRTLTEPDKMRLIQILSDELDAQGDIYPLQPHKIYYLSTPYNSFGAGRILMETMQSLEFEIERHP